MATASGEVTTVSSGNAGSVPSNGGGNADAIVGGDAMSTGKEDSALRAQRRQLHLGLPTCHIPTKRMVFFPNQCLHFHNILFCFLRAAPTVYGDSQARSQIGVVAASLHHSHSNARSEPCL